MSSEANYSEFTVLPAWTAAQWGAKNPVNGDRELLNPDDPYKWSGANPPPAIGATVKLYLNDFKGGTVVSYFVEYGWLGVLVKPSAPPAWWVRQNKERAKERNERLVTTGHFFGIDLEPRKVPSPS